MALDTYAALQASILSWLARPGDPLVSPSIPDIIQLFEHEATRRLKVGGAEKRASLTALSAAVALPADFGELRLATSGGVILTYVTPMQLPDGGGPPAHYTIIGNELRLGPSPSGGCTIEIVYQSGVPPLSDTNTTNWLLTAHPDCYLFGSLVEAESFIGSDERVPLWAQRREAAFASIETADRKARWGGAPLSIRAEGVSGGNGTAAGDWTSAPPVPIPIASIVAGDGLTGGGTEGIVTVALSTPVTIGRGGTGAATAAAALANLGGAPLASPALTGNPTAPTPSAGDADTSIATTAFVGAALSAQALAGDVTGPTGTTAVVRLQGRPVAATAPTSLQVLQWSGTNWVPATIAVGGTLTGVTAGTGITVSGAAPSPTVALTVPVAVANGGTGSTTAGAALTALGAAPLNAPVFTGDARAVTPATADNDTSIATTAYVQAQGYATSPVSVAQGGTAKTSWTTGSVAFAGSATALAEDNANLFWDDTNNRLGLGMAPRGERLSLEAGVGLAVYYAQATYLIRGLFYHAGNSGGSLGLGGLTIGVQGTSQATANAGDINFLTTPAASAGNNTDATYALAMKIRYNGNVGINTTTPQQRLAVTGGSGAATGAGGEGIAQFTTGTGLSTNEKLQFGVVDGAYSWIQAVKPGTAARNLVLQSLGGNVGVGNTAGGGNRLQVTSSTGSTAGGYCIGVLGGPAGADTTTSLVGFTDGGNTVLVGAITRNGTNTVAYGTSSDERLKSDITGSERGLEALLALRVSDYRMGETRQQGLLAQQVREHYPEAVIEGGDDPNLQPWMIDYGRLTPLLIKALQEAMARIEALEGKPAAPVLRSPKGEAG